MHFSCPKQGAKQALKRGQNRPFGHPSNSPKTALLAILPATSLIGPLGLLPRPSTVHRARRKVQIGALLPPAPGSLRASAALCPHPLLGLLPRPHTVHRARRKVQIGALLPPTCGSLHGPLRRWAYGGAASTRSQTGQARMPHLGPI